jgi:hypothetical protein
MWTAVVEIVSGSSDGPVKIGRNVSGKVEADSEAEALEGAKFVLNSIATGKFAHIRCRPEADTWEIFDTKETIYRGYVRFSVFDEPGEWDYGNAYVNLPLTAS